MIARPLAWSVPLPRPSRSPAVTVVLCTWNRATLLEGALAALVAQTDPPDHEIVVVDNDSTDDTRLVIERYAAAHPQVRYVFEGAAGLSHARNTGVAHTTGRVVAFTDDDVRVPPDWLRDIADDERASSRCGILRRAGSARVAGDRAGVAH